MIFKSTFVYLVVMLVFSGLPTLAEAQIADESGGRNAYYIDINATNKSSVFEIQDGMLCLRYNDRYGRAKSVHLTLYNWKREVIAKYELEKTFGLNYFTIHLARDLELEQDKLYSCRIPDEMGHSHEVFFRPVANIQTEQPEINILVNPISFECEDPRGNFVEFYADIKRGKAPYSINWYVMNNTRTDLLYQPIAETISNPGHTTLISVDHNPDYYVLLLVKDACGAESRQMVHLVCGDRKRKINTVFVEPLRSLPGQVKSVQ